MPIPVLLGLPWLASVVGGFIALTVSFFAQYFTKKLLMVGIAVGAAVVFTVAFISGLESLLASFYASAPAELTHAVTLFMPSNGPACVVAIITAHIIKWGYGWSVKILDWKVS